MTSIEALNAMGVDLAGRTARVKSEYQPDIVLVGVIARHINYPDGQGVVWMDLGHPGLDSFNISALELVDDVG